MRTAIETLIDELTKSAAESRRRVEEFRSTQMVMTSSELTSGAMAIAYDMAIKKATELLETEKKQIVDAYTEGQRGIVEIIVENHGPEYFHKTLQQFREIEVGGENEDAEEYFNNTYKK